MLAALLASRPVVLHDRRADCVPYERALSWQRALHAERAAQLLPRGEQPARDATTNDKTLEKHENMNNFALEEAKSDTL